MANDNAVGDNDVVSDKIFQYLSSVITHDWKDLGRNLGISNATLDQIQSDHPFRQKEQVYKMLIHWSQSKGSSATYNILYTALDTSQLTKQKEEVQTRRQEDKSVSSTKTSDICEEHKALQEAICLVCYEKLCYACAYRSHRYHQIVPKDDVAAKVQDDFKAVFETLDEDKKALDNGIKILEGKIQSPNENNLKTFVEESVAAIQAMKEKCTYSIKEATQLGATYLKHITTVLSKVENDIFLTEEEIDLKPYYDVFTKLLDLNKIDNKMQGCENEIHKISQMLKDGSMAIFIRPTSISGDIARIIHGCILGAVMPNKNQVVIIRSQGNPSKTLKFECTSCFKPPNLYWEYTFHFEQGPYPFVVGNTLLITSRQRQILVGYGSKLIIFQMNSCNDLLYFVKRSTINVDIPNNSHIIGLAPITGKLQDRGVIVSDKISGILQILDNNFQVSMKVKYPGVFQMITCVFRENIYKCAVTCPKLQSADLLMANHDEEKPREFGKLKVANSNFHPQSLLFDGVFFTVLWVSSKESYGKGQKWKVVAYKEDGEEFNICKEGSCEPNITAVSISHVQNDTLLCFSNGTVDLFQTAKI